MTTDNRDDVLALAEELNEAAEIEGMSQGSTTTIATLRKAARALSRPVPEGWQPIATAPKDDTIFLTYGDGKTFVAKGSILAHGRRADTPEHLSMRYITHWMPLPAPPRLGADQEGGR